MKVPLRALRIAFRPQEGDRFDNLIRTQLEPFAANAKMAESSMKGFFMFFLSRNGEPENNLRHFGLKCSFALPWRPTMTYLENPVARVFHDIDKRGEAAAAQLLGKRVSMSFFRLSRSFFLSACLLNLHSIQPAFHE